MLLEINDVHVHYHKVAALKGIDMEVPDDGIVTIIGANGAGKSTTLRAISGLVGISKGAIVLPASASTGLPEKIVALGIAHVPEGRRVFPGLTVEENCAPVPSCARHTEDRQGSRRGVPALPGKGRGNGRGLSRAASSRCSPSAGR